MTFRRTPPPASAKPPVSAGRTGSSAVPPPPTARSGVRLSASEFRSAIEDAKRRKALGEKLGGK